MPSTLIQYSYLQLLDLLTTIAFLVQGVQEGNPVVRMAIGMTASPITGLLMVKALALVLGFYCWRAEKVRLLGRVNIMFALLIAWNLVALILGSVLPGSLA